MVQIELRNSIDQWAIAQHRS